jgi:excisionase family DNA binding protein
MSRLQAVSDAARELAVNESRVRALIAAGELEAEKVGGRWLIDSSAVARRKRAESGPGRPLSPRNAWALLCLASGESPPDDLDGVSRWRLDQSLDRQGVVGMRARLSRRGRPLHFRALRGELRALHADDRLMLSGSSAAGAHRLDLLAPDAIDAYVPVSALDELVAKHALEAVSLIDANVILRAVPEGVWASPVRRTAPLAVVALDLADYPDSRSSRVGHEVLDRLAKDRLADE